ncbi:MAG TPA: LysM peptidoglycan-binding domain-containing protein [Chloroflexia bacterium]|nr:LysM peptidoglycan-binding domain-containing protein [Chloroflexia bacterium]
MAPRRLAIIVALCIILTVPMMGCDGGSGSNGERIRLVITPVPTPTPTPLPLPTVGATTYTVQAGDTLSGIASHFGVTVDAIVRVNNIADPNSLSEGQVLNIPAREVEPPTTLPVSTAGVPIIDQTPIITGTLTPGPNPTETLPPPDATPPQGPDIPEPTVETPSTPGPINSPTAGP